MSGTSHSKSSTVARELKHAASTEHKAALATHKMDSAIREAQVLSSGNSKRIKRYFFRKFAYKLFGKFMGKTMAHL